MGMLDYILGGQPISFEAPGAPPQPPDMNFDQTVLPLAVQAAMRKAQMMRQQQGYNQFAGAHNAMGEDQARYYAERMGAADPFPIGQEFTNQANQPRFTHDVPSGRLSALSQLIAGLGPSMGSQAPMQPAPQTLTMGSMPSVDPTQSILRSNMTGVDPLVSSVTRNPNGSKQLQAGGSKIGVTNEAAYNENRQRVHASEQAKTDLLAQRGIARGEAKNLRQMGNSPQVAAILAALQGQGGDTGDMAKSFLMGNILGGPAAGGAFVKEQGDRKWNQQQLDVKREEIGLKNPQAAAKPGATDPNAPQTEATKNAAPPNPVIQAQREAADAAAPPADNVEKTRRDEVTRIITNYTGKVKPYKAKEFASHYLQKQYGLTPAQAAATVTNATGEAFGGYGIDPEDDPELHPFTSGQSVQGGAADTVAKWLHRTFGEDFFNRGN